MADEQGLDTPDGWFSRQVLGDAVKKLVQNVGRDGRNFPTRDSPPDNPELGDVYLADGSNWDPDSDGSGNPELVAYDSSGAWSEIIEL